MSSLFESIYLKTDISNLPMHYKTVKRVMQNQTCSIKFMNKTYLLSIILDQTETHEIMLYSQIYSRAKKSAIHFSCLHLYPLESLTVF